MALLGASTANLYVCGCAACVCPWHLFMHMISLTVIQRSLVLFAKLCSSLSPLETEAIEKIVESEVNWRCSISWIAGQSLYPRLEWSLNSSGINWINPPLLRQSQWLNSTSPFNTCPKGLSMWGKGNYMLPVGHCRSKERARETQPCLRNVLWKEARWECGGEQHKASLSPESHECRNTYLNSYYKLYVSLGLPIIFVQ